MRATLAFPALCLMMALAWPSAVNAAPAKTAASPASSASPAVDPRPHLVEQGGRRALFVDGAPFLMLGAQAHNSSNSVQALQQVWPAVQAAHANTLEIPVAWEQVEAVEGRFDFSYVDELIRQARQRQVRLVLLWFGAWKNTSPQYVPAWVKFDNRRFPRMVNAEGRTHYVLSPFGEDTLKHDRRAFVALMGHLKQVDQGRHTVIMVQVENEVGSYGLARDHGPAADAAFKQAVPAEVLRAQKRPVAAVAAASSASSASPDTPAPAALKASGTWAEVYGDYAEQYFHTWAVARYLEALAAAGRAVYDLPMYVNNALRDPLAPLAPWKNDFASGGPTYDVIGIYKAVAPHIDIVGPDLYSPESAKVTATLGQFQRADNPLFVPEMSNGEVYARYVYDILGRGALGVAPFGLDHFPYSNYPLGSPATDASMVAPFGRIYAAFRPLERQWARWAFEGRTAGAAEGDDGATQTLALPLGGWKAAVSFGEWQFGERAWLKPGDVPPWAGKRQGGVSIAQTGPDEFVLVGQRARVRIEPVQDLGNGHGAAIDHVEEGRFGADGRWVATRRWNGDQVDWGLNLGATPVTLKIRMGRY